MIKVSSDIILKIATKLRENSKEIQTLEAEYKKNNIESKPQIYLLINFNSIIYTFNRADSVRNTRF